METYVNPNGRTPLAVLQCLHNGEFRVMFIRAGKEVGNATLSEDEQHYTVKIPSLPEGITLKVGTSVMEGSRLREHPDLCSPNCVVGVFNSHNRHHLTALAKAACGIESASEVALRNKID